MRSNKRASHRLIADNAMAILSFSAVGLLSSVLFFSIVSTFTAQAAKAAMGKAAYEIEINKLFMNTQFEDARKLCAKAIAENPKEKVFFLMKEGEIYIVATKGRSGLEAGREAAKLAPKNAQAIATASILEFLAGFVVKGEQLARKALEIDSKNGRAHAALALSGLRLETIPINEELATAMKLAPKDPTVFIIAGIIHLRRLEYDQAEASYSAFVKAFPNTALPYYQRGYFRREVFNNSGAIKDLGEVIKRFDRDTYVRTTRAKLNKKTGHHKDAIEDFSALVKMGSANYGTYSRRAECYAALNNYEAAIKDFKIALEKAGATDKNFPQRYKSTNEKTRRSAWIKVMSGNDAAELSDLKSTWLKLIMLEEKHGHYDDAIKDLSAFMETFPGDLNSIHLRHKVYKKTGKYVEALADISLLISKNPNVSEYYISRAELFTKLGKPDRAKSDMKRANNLETTGNLEGN